MTPDGAQAQSADERVEFEKAFPAAKADLSPGDRYLIEAWFGIFSRGWRAALAAAPPAVVPAEPVVWIRKHPDGTYADEVLPNRMIERVRRESGGWEPLGPIATPPVAAAPRGGTSAEALKTALAGNMPLSGDQRAVLLTMVVEADTLGQKYDADIERIQAAVKAAAPVPVLTDELHTLLREMVRLHKKRSCVLAAHMDLLADILATKAAAPQEKP